MLKQKQRQQKRKPGDKVWYGDRQFVLIEPIDTTGWLAVEAKRVRRGKKSLEACQALETFLVALNEFLTEEPKDGQGAGGDS